MTSSSVQCWGNNLYGQLGDGTTTSRYTPEGVSGLTSGVSVIAAGYYHTCALKTSGGVKCWGWNADGQLGDGTTTDRHTPVDVVGFSQNIFSISGKVADDSNIALSGVTLLASTGTSAVTNASGLYTITNVITGTYTITPTKSGYALSPSSRIATVPPDATGQNFIAAQPNGNITAPTNNVTTGLTSMQFTANAWEFNNGTGVKQVEFYVFYDGVWHAVDVVTASPYQTIWQTPTNLKSQQVWFAINVLDTAGNIAYAAGGLVKVNFVENLGGNTGVNVNWILSRLYLNQRSLNPQGDYKCAASSIAMVLAANGIIAPDYATMAGKANEMDSRVRGASPGMMATELNNQGMNAANPIYTKSQAWVKIKQEVDAGRPVIFNSAPRVQTQDGHYFVVVGYREITTSTPISQVIAYDPFGKWQEGTGYCNNCLNNYDGDTSDPASHKGKWVYYDFNTLFISSSNVIAATLSASTSALTPRKITTSPSTPPDATSDEPANVVTYSGVKSNNGLPIYLPLIMR